MSTCLRCSGSTVYRDNLGIPHECCRTGITPTGPLSRESGMPCSTVPNDYLDIPATYDRQTAELTHRDPPWLRAPLCAPSMPVVSELAASRAEVEALREELALALGGKWTATEIARIRKEAAELGAALGWGESTEIEALKAKVAEADDDRVQNVRARDATERLLIARAEKAEAHLASEQAMRKCAVEQVEALKDSAHRDALARERDAALARVTALEGALLGISSQRQFGPCWCSTIAGTYCVGQDRCKAASAALSAPEGGAK